MVKLPAPAVFLCLLGVFSGLANPRVAIGQDATFKITALKSIPAPPFVTSIPDGTSWTVTIERPAKTNPSETPDPSKVSVTSHALSGGVRRTISGYGGKTQPPIYLTKSALLYVDPQSGKPQAQSSLDPSGGPAPRPEHFEELNWISADTYLGEATFRGHACDVFRKYFGEPSLRNSGPNQPGVDVEIPTISGVPYAQVAGNPNAKVMETALIDRKTKLPVAREESGMLSIYEFSTDKSSFRLPPEFSAALAAFEKD